MILNIQNTYTNFEYVLGNMSFVYIVAVPVLTMRVIAEEKRQKTDRLLYSLPLSMSQVTMGKYLSMLTVLAVPTVVIGIYPLIYSAFGDVDLGITYGALLAFFLLGAALLAIGMFVSSVTESQAVAAGLCLIIMLINYFIADIAAYIPTTAFASFIALAVCALLIGAVFWLMTRSMTASVVIFIILMAANIICYMLIKDSYASLFSTFVGSLSLFERFYSFMNGIFDVRALVYFLSVAGLCVFLSVQALEKRRWSE
jgi:ABC-2 type transport system permease protein